jgi:hypothetical protein
MYILLRTFCYLTMCVYSCSCSCVSKRTFGNVVDIRQFENIKRILEMSIACFLQSELILWNWVLKEQEFIKIRKFASFGGNLSELFNIINNH